MSEVDGGAPAPESVDNAESTENIENTEVQASGEGVQPDEGSKPEEQPDDGTGVRKFIVKVNGQEQEVTEDELIQGYQTRKASDEKFREAAMSKKQAEEFINLLRTNPRKVLTNPDLGIDMRKLAEEYLVEQMEEEMMDPKDKELRDAKRQLQEIEDEKKRKAKEEEESQAVQLKEKYSQEYSSQIVDALQSSGLPKSEHTVKRMAYYMHQGLQRGYNLSAKDVVGLVKQDYIDEQKSLFGQLDGDMLVQLLGDDVANKIRKYDVGRVKSTEKQLKTPDKQPEGGSPRPKKSKKISKDDWKARMERIKNGEE